MKFSSASFNKTIPFWLPYFILAIFGILYLIMSFCNHYFFRTWAWDYGSYNFAFYDYAHFRNSDNPVLPFPMKFLQDHISFTLMLLAPFYWIFSWLTGTYTLTFLQIFIVLLGGLALHKLLLLKTSDKLLALLGLLQYFVIYGRWASFCSACNLAIIASSLIPLFLYLFEKKRFLNSFLILAFLLLTREDIALWTFFIGLFLLMTHLKDRIYLKMSGIVILTSILYFMVVFKVIIPAVETPQVTYHLFNYTVLGNDPTEAFLYIVRHPIKAIELLFVNHDENPVYNGVKFEFYYVYLMCGGFLLFYRPVYLLLFIPLLLKKMYNDLPVRWSIESYYSIEFVTMLPIAVFIILYGIKNKVIRNILIAFVCLNTLGMTAFKLLEKGRELNYDNTNFAFYRKSMYRAVFDVQSVYQHMKLIPKDIAVSAGNSINPHLAYRPKAYFFPRVEDAEYIAVFNARDTWPLEINQFKKELNKYRFSDDWETLVDDSTLVILRKVK